MNVKGTPFGLDQESAIMAGAIHSKDGRKTGLD